MAYKIFIKKSAQKYLLSLPTSGRNRAVEKIVLLGSNPSLDVKPMQGVRTYRLRVGSWRVIFDKRDDIKVISVERIKPQGEVYK